MSSVKSPYLPVSVPHHDSVPDFFFHQISKYHGDSVALIWVPEKQSYSFNELKRIVSKLTVGLHRLGLRKGDVVGTFTSNCPEFVFFIVAAQRLGAIVATCNPAYTPAELAAQFNSCRVKYLFTEYAYLNTIEAALPKIPTVKNTIVIHSEAKTRGNYVNYADLFASDEINDRDIVPKLDPSRDACFILFSSGTSGLPKGILINHRQFYTNVVLLMNQKGAETPLELGNGDSVIGAFPFFHAAGLFMGIFWTLVQGRPLVIVPKYEPEQFLKAIETYKVTTVVLVPPIVVFLSKTAIIHDFNLSSIRTVITAGAPLPKDAALEAASRLGVQHLIQMYGMTELMFTHMQPISKLSKSKVGTVGIPLPNTETKVVNPETFEMLPASEIGELWVRTPCAMNGYLNNPNATREMFHDGWGRTGDMGRYDKDGYFFIEDRLKELIKVRGFQVAPAELEALILTHPSVADVIVVGVPDHYSGELPRAYVVLKPGITGSEQEIQDFVKSNVTRYKQLAAGVRFVAELPKTASGKLLRRHLRDEARKEVIKSKM